MLKEQRPVTKSIVTSGTKEDVARNSAYDAFLPKPYRMPDLEARLEQVLAGDQKVEVAGSAGASIGASRPDVAGVAAAQLVRPERMCSRKDGPLPTWLETQVGPPRT